MEFAYTPAAEASSPLPLDPSRVADACRAAIDAVAAAGSPDEALDAALGVLREQLSGAFVAALVSERERLWLVGSRGFGMIPDGLPIGSGVVGRAARTGRVQYVPDLAADPDYVDAVRGVASELAIPLRVGDEVVGVVDVETVVPLPRQAARLMRPLAEALAPVVDAVRGDRPLDLHALARLFVYVSSLRDPREIAEIVAAALARVLPLETSQLFLRGEDGGLELAALSRAAEGPAEALAVEAVEALRATIDQWAVVEQLDLARQDLAQLVGPEIGAAVLIPLRANDEEHGVLVGTSRWPQEIARAQTEVAAVLGAHAAAALDAAMSLRRARRSALTDPLTSLLNRRGFELELEHALVQAQETRRPLSLWILDCDDFKDVNDRAGHEFGDALLREAGHVLVSSLPAGARGGRLGGDEFVVMLPGTDAASAELIAGDLQSRVMAGLDDAGFPLRLSIGVATYPFDGGSSSQLVRAADQALYEAKATGKNRVVGFRELLRGGSRITPSLPIPASEGRGGRADVSVLADTSEAASAIWSEDTVEAVLERLCKSLSFVVGATGCNASRVVGSKLVDEVAHALRDVDLEADASYLIDDFPVTKAVLESGESKAISFLDDDLDRAEAFVLREVRMNCALLVPIVVDRRPWGLIELYDMRLRRYSREQQAVAEFLVGMAARRIEALGDAARADKRLPLYRLPDSGP